MPSSPLSNVVTRTRALDRARIERDDAILAAIDAGAKVAAVAIAAGLTRERVYQMLRHRNVSAAEARELLRQAQAR
jgi:DNA-binding phage protein